MMSPSLLFFSYKFILFIYFWLHWVFIASGLSLVAESGGYSSLWCAGFSLRWLLLLRSTGSRHKGFSSCGTRASVVVARGLQSTGSVVVAHRLSCSAACGIFPDQGSNRVPCLGKRILNHCATRDVPKFPFIGSEFLSVGTIDILDRIILCYGKAVLGIVGCLAAALAYMQ